MDDGTLKDAKRLYESGLSLREVADELDENRGTIHYHLKKMGITRSVSESLQDREIHWSEKISESLEGHEISEETKEKISEIHSGKEPWNKGKTKKTHPDEINYGRAGEDHHEWKGGISSELDRLRQTPEYKIWRRAVFERDDWTCQECSQRGGELNAHHVKPFSEYPEYRFDVSNGVTLCKSCHNKKHRA